MLHKSYQTEILPNLSNAALLGILWVIRVFTKGGRPAFADLLAEQVLWQARAATRRQLESF